MNQTDKELLIIYEIEAEQWATYLHSIFTGPISQAGICCYDIAQVSSWRGDFLCLAQYTCKLLILSKGMLEGLCQMQRFFLARVLSPADHVVVLLCGVESLTSLLEMVPLNGDECLQISSEQDAHEYLSAVTDIVRKDVSTSATNANPLTRKASRSDQNKEQVQPTGARSVRSSIVVVPSRVSCGSSMEVFILLKNEAAGNNAEVEFSGENQTVRVKPARWNEKILCINAPDFPAGNVEVTVYSNGLALSKAHLQYYTTMEEITSLLARAADPVDFMCQAFQESSVERLDQKLSSMLLEGMPSGGFQGLQCRETPERKLHQADAPSLLHFAAQYGLKSVSSLLLQCPGAERALQTVNCHGQTPAEMAKNHGHAELHVLLKETLNMFNPAEDDGDASVYEMMCTAGTPSMTDVQTEQGGEEEEKKKEEEDIYTPLGVNDEYDTILKPTKAVATANRPPAPTPRPESTQVKEDKTPYIAKVFQKKKKPQGEADLYSLPTKQAREREDSISSIYDTFVPNQKNGLQQLTELQQRMKAGSLSVDGNLECSNDLQQGQKGIDSIQKEKPSQLRANTINKREVDDSVYDRINAAHQTPSVAVTGGRRGSQTTEADFDSKTLKGQHLNFFSKADKR
ncbi:B-cell scaffold protein with ankyrin repeats-like [Notolabrus celidotus]|uniref:B-cell scaffold protein with ankyrin repeats-like n=1 Tax=Notolabrus celidotus TaxID=1203425 RepID=UPI00149040A0|nr:B-cell scaffold protein with ankyrin repeats-like [Notolabrus celidotus]